MTVTQLDSRLGAEDVQFSVFSLLVENLNDAIDVENARQAARIDGPFETLTGRGLGTITAEHVDLANFHMGHRPSMIDAPSINYPSVTVMAYTTSPAPTNVGMDHQRDHSIVLAVECLVKSDPVPLDDDSSDGEEVVERRVKRTGEAIAYVVAMNRDLDGYVFAPTQEPVVSWGEVFARDEVIDGTDERFFWQGVRLQYTYGKTSPIFNLNIDQA